MEYEDMTSWRQVAAGTGAVLFLGGVGYLFSTFDLDKADKTASVASLFVSLLGLFLSLAALLSSRRAAGDGKGGVHNVITGGEFYGQTILTETYEEARLDDSDRKTLPEQAESAENKIVGGVFVGTVIMGKYVSLTLPPTVPAALGGLPPAVTGFTGRETELSQMLNLLDPEGAHAGAVTVSAIAGLAGAGKTELAIQAACAAEERGWCPGGVLFIDLHGYDEARRLNPGQALNLLLRALAVPPDHIPPETDARAVLFRSVLSAFAKQGRRVLVIVDNAFSAQHVEHLLPGDDHTYTIVTSRHTMAGLKRTRLLELAELSSTAAVHLLGRALEVARGERETRVRDHPEDARRIAQLCGHLPLALQIIASLLGERPERTLAAMAADLHDARTRLDEIQHEERAVRAAFELSYRHLDQEHARLFAWLPLSPGPHLSTEAAAQLVDQDVRAVQRRLEDLARAHLIEGAAPFGERGRWRMHDLIRLYAEELAREETKFDAGARARQVTAAVRVLSHYLHLADAAEAHLQAAPETPSLPDDFSSRVEALRWCEVERANLIAAVATAQEISQPRIACGLPLALGFYLIRYRYFEDLIFVTGIGVEAARRIGQSYSEGLLLIWRSAALRESHRLDEALEAAAHSVALLQAYGDPDDLGQAYTSYGNALAVSGRNAEALDMHRRAAQANHQMGNAGAEGQAWANMGHTLILDRRFEEATEALLEARRLFQQEEDTHGEAVVLCSLCASLKSLGRLDEAIRAGEQAAALHQRNANPHGVGSALGLLAEAFHEAGQNNKAIELARRSIELLEEAQDRKRAGSAWLVLAKACLHGNRLRDAIDAFERALVELRQGDDPGAEGAAECCLAATLIETGRVEEALEPAYRSLAIFQRLGDTESEVQAWILIGDIAKKSGSPEQAMTAHRRLAEAYEQLDDTEGAGQARWYLGSALEEEGRLEEAASEYRGAHRLLQRAGAPEWDAHACWSLGRVLGDLEDFDGAADALSQACQLFESTGALEQAETVCHGLTINLWAAGRTGEARRAHSRHLKICRKTGNRLAEGEGWGSLGVRLSGAGLYDEAITAYRNAQSALPEEATDVRAGVAIDLGLALGHEEQFAMAEESFRAAIDLSRKAGKHEIEARAWAMLGGVLAATERLAEAKSALESAISLYRDAGLADEADTIRALLIKLE
ncbi:tetratricopeptide repeat protein [Nonomuraea sp. NPDC048916]|uniref:tetratricopeptide repeat protein n=1 Tax=Nonomuraea sp. NPDC048916 TaxID=3154232 RepID=UPI0034109F08